MKQYLSKSFALTLLLLTISNDVRPLTDGQKAAIVVGVVGGGIAIGAVGRCFYRRSYYNSVEYQKIVVQKAYEVVKKAINCSPQIESLQQGFNFRSMNDSQKRVAVDNGNTERILYTLVNAINNKGIIGYLTDLEDVIKSLKSRKDKLGKALTKLSNKIATSYEANSTYNDVKNLLDKIETLIPDLEFLQSFVNRHKEYYKLHPLGEKLAKEFERDMQILAKNSTTVIDELKNYIKTKYFDKNISYPLLTYIDTTTKGINEIENTLNRLAFKYPHITEQSQKLLIWLKRIRELVVVDRDYLIEKVAFDAYRERQETLRKERELKEREIRLQEKKAREERELKERELELKEKKARDERELKERELRAREKEVEAKQLEAVVKVEEVGIKAKEVAIKAAEAYKPSAPPAYADVYR